MTHRARHRKFLCESCGVVENEWAMTTLTVWNGSSEQHTELSGVTLVEQLGEAEAVLTQLAATPADPLASNVSVRLFSSWTPQQGRYSMTLPGGLVKALAALDGAFWMDVYPTDPTERVNEG
jgi:hypothetical protein